MDGTDGRQSTVLVNTAPVDRLVPQPCDRLLGVDTMPYQPVVVVTQRWEVNHRDGRRRRQQVCRDTSSSSSLACPVIWDRLYS